MASIRRLAAILAADVAGYSRLMEADEEGTHERLQALFAELVHPKIEEHRGRAVKNTGDGVMAEFASVVEAVRCAAEIQRGMIDRGADFPEERHISFRIGINLGDIIVEAHDIFGDGVNIAARLEGLAPAGGICISGTVRDHIGDRLSYAFEDIGEQSVKNIARPVRAYVLRAEDIAGLRMASAPGSPGAAPRPSIVVLPFTNLSDDREQQYFADAITEDVTTDLSRLPHSFVISCNTAFTYRNKRIGTKQIGRELGVRYVLEGGVRRSGNQLRVSAQLIDAATDAHLWAERFAGETGDLLALQNEVTSRIANALGIELIAAEAARPIEQPDAFDYILRGRAAALEPYSRDKYAEQIGLFEHALALDPQSLEAKTGLANALAVRVLTGLSDSRAADLTRAAETIGQALAASPRYALAHAVKGNVLRAQYRWQEAIVEYETALASNRNALSALFGLAICKLCSGSIDEVIPLVEQCIRLSPRDPGIGFCCNTIGTVHLLQSQTDAAVAWLEKARNASPGSPMPRSRLAAACALRGDTERAVAELADARRVSGGDLFLSIARLKAHPGAWQGIPKIRALYESTYFAGLRMAGMPEE